MSHLMALQAHREAIPMVIRPGQILPNGATVVAAKAAGTMSSPDNGFILLALTHPGDGGEYATWYARNNADGMLVTSQGDYFQPYDFAGAVASFNDRH